MKHAQPSHDQWEPQLGSKAVIYCRVSSNAQLRKGDGLGSQETRCRQFAQAKGYEVVQVFRDEGASGGMIDRPGMREMLHFLKRQKRDQYVVVIDDISRLARGLEAHFQLRALISSVGAKLVSPSIEFGEDSDSLLVENMLASVSQHQRQKNAEQTKNRMKARVMNGYWCSNPPVGYTFSQVPGHSGRMMVRNEPVASLVKAALEGYAFGKLDSLTEVKRFLEHSPHFPKDHDGEVHYQRVKNLLRKVLYAGYIDVPKWNLYRHPAKHEPLISYETFQAIQDRLNGKPKAPVRKDLNADFPLRGFVTCSGCGKPMTASWASGRSRKYPYYDCHTKGCPQHRKSIRKEVVEGDFEALLKQLTPSPALFGLARNMFQDIWDDRQQLVEQESQAMKAQIPALDRQVEKYLQRLTDTDNSIVVKKYEHEITRLEEQKIVLREKIAKCGRPLDPFEDCFRTAMIFLSNPCYLWSSDRLEDKRMVLRMVFLKKLPYDRDGGFRTAKTDDLSLPFRYLQNFNGGKYEVARPEGVEPPTLGSEVQCSIH